MGLIILSLCCLAVVVIFLILRMLDKVIIDGIYGIIEGRIYLPLSAENFVSAGMIIIAGIMAYKKLHPVLIICVSGLLGIAAGCGLAWWNG